VWHRAADQGVLGFTTSLGFGKKFGLWQARRHGTAERLERLATERAAGTPR
jgi:hypothetical protein